jgi:hypothetical protein
VNIDGLDQALQETGFIWSTPYTCEVIARKKSPEGYYLKARHNGYRRLKKPVWHTRTLIWLSGEGFVLKDTFEGTGRHLFELNFHCHPDAEVGMENGYWVIENNAAKIFLVSASGDSFMTESGLESPPFGWFSPAYGTKRPCTVLSSRKESVPEELEFITAVWLRPPEEIELLKERFAEFERQAAHP